MKAQKTSLSPSLDGRNTEKDLASEITPVA